MKYLASFRQRRGVRNLTVLLGLLAGTCAGQGITEITLPGTRVFPESITSTKDGTLIVGSMGHGYVLRIPPGKTEATEWIKPGAGGLGTVLGVLADEKGKTLWICSMPGGAGQAPALKSFDLKTAAPKETYPLPGQGGVCNDIAVGADGTAYVADTRQAQVLMLRPNAKALEVAAKDPLLAGADGLAFGDKTTLYVNSVSAGKLLRVDLGADGKAKSVVDLKLPRPLERPDGMRAIGKHRLLLAENSGKMTVLTIAGQDRQTVTIQVLKEGMASTPATTATKGMAWVAEGKLSYRSDPALRDKDPGPFKMYAVPLPKK